jgi:CBS domain-containing protein
VVKTWTVEDVMTKAVVSVDEAASYRDVVDLLIERRCSAVPVVDGGHRVIGVVEVLSGLTYDVDDRQTVAAPMPFF